MLHISYFIAIMSAALLLSQAGQSVNAQPEKSSRSRAGGAAASHMSEKGLENTNAQWSADPERGWQRAEERHELQKKGKQPAKKRSENPKGKSKRGLWD